MKTPVGATDAPDLDAEIAFPPDIPPNREDWSDGDLIQVLYNAYELCVLIQSAGGWYKANPGSDWKLVRCREPDFAALLRSDFEHFVGDRPLSTYSFHEALNAARVHIHARRRRMASDIDRVLARGR